MSISAQYFHVRCYQSANLLSYMRISNTCANSNTTVLLPYFIIEYQSIVENVFSKT